MKKTMQVQGMMCAGCEGRLKRILEALHGVDAAVTSHTQGTAEVTLSKEVSDETLKQTTEAAGFKVLGIE